MTDNLLHGEALQEYEDFKQLLNLYRQDAIENFLLKYPMLKNYEERIKCDTAVTDHGLIIVPDVLFEITLDYHRVDMIHIIALAKTGDLAATNHTVTEIFTDELAKPVKILARLQLKQFFYSPFDLSITAY